MSTPNPQPGPIAQQVPSGAANSQHPTQGKPQKQPAQWTGFAGKTLWDWLNLLGAAVLIPVVIAAASIWFSVQQSQLAKQQHDSDQAIALDQQRQTVLQTYEDNIKDLLLTKGLHTSKSGDGMRSVARAETLAALRQLDGDRKGLLAQFLYEADLIIRHSNGDVIIPLNQADLSHANLSDANLSGVDLSHANLSDANLSGVDLSRATLSNANLFEANLSGVDLSSTTLSGVDLEGANLSGATLRGADLSGVELRDAFLSSADLTGAHLGGAILLRADLSGATLRGADLRKADLLSATLSNADLRGADLRGADLSSADLSKATISQDQLQQASSLQGATMPDGSKHP